MARTRQFQQPRASSSPSSGDPHRQAVDGVDRDRDGMLPLSVELEPQPGLAERVEQDAGLQPGEVRAGRDRPFPFLCLQKHVDLGVHVSAGSSCCCHVRSVGGTRKSAKGGKCIRPVQGGSVKVRMCGSVTIMKSPRFQPFQAGPGCLRRRPGMLIHERDDTLRPLGVDGGAATVTMLPGSARVEQAGRNHAGAQDRYFDTIS